MLQQLQRRCWCKLSPFCSDIHWSQPGERRLTGGTNWQPKAAPTTTWNPVSMVTHTYCSTRAVCRYSSAMLVVYCWIVIVVIMCVWRVNALFSLQPPSVMAFPATTPTGMMGYAMVSIVANEYVQHSTEPQVSNMFISDKSNGSSWID